ncbi:phenylacetyl-CoA ligase [Ganoderma leucocontextum]|nr:phenylacetyl-CoA ligase [Ganoderma leucocontextum]
MTIFRAQGPPFVPPRDDMTLPQFILDDVDAERTRPVRPAHVPCLIDSETGKAVHLGEVRAAPQLGRHALARSLKARWNIGICSTSSKTLISPCRLRRHRFIWAIKRLGGSVAAHSSTLTADEFAYQLGITESSLVVAYPSNLQVALSAMKACRIPETSLVLLDGHLAPDAPFPPIESLIEEHESHAPYVEHKFKPGEAKTAVAFLCFSSGTTGNPKAVAVSHSNAICAIIQNAMSNRLNEQYTPWKDQRFRPGDICDGTLRSGHRLMYRLIQMTLVVAKAFVFEKYLQNIQRYRITNLTMVPPQAVLLCKHPLTKKYDLSSVRYCVVAAAPLSPELTTELLKVMLNGAPLPGLAGMTETSWVVSNFPTSMKVGVLGSCGRLAPGTIAKVVKEDGELAGVGESGELLVQGPQIVVGYFRIPKATEEAFDNGWLRTGDEVRFDAEGNIFIVDRIKELIKVKGLQVAPSELEGYLLSDPDVADAAVIGVPDEYAGELPRAYVVLKPVVADAVKKDERLAGQVRAGLYETIASAAAKYKRLEGGIEFMDAIPKNPSGKILRRVLREQGQRSGGQARARL